MIEPKLEITNLITPFINSFKTIINEWDHFSGDGVSNYLRSQYEKYYFTNTFIHRGEKVRFHNVYYPIKVEHKLLTTDFSNLRTVLTDYKNITIVGTAGSGKTTLLKYIFLNSIDTKYKIPVVIELRNLNGFGGSFEDLIGEKMLKLSVKPNRETLNRTFKSGKFLFLLDGYDEITFSKKQEINRQIELFIDAYPENNFIISTRPGAGIEGFPRFQDFTVCSLDSKDIISLSTKITLDRDRLKRLLRTIKNPQNETYTSYLSNPLLLSMFILTFESHPEIPSRKSSFYYNVFDALFSKHDSINKNSFQRDRKTRLSREDFENILGYFSFTSLRNQDYTFKHEYLITTFNKIKKYLSIDYDSDMLLYDLETSISILVLDGLEYSFPHRSLQEYFAAKFIASLGGEIKKKAYQGIFDTLEDLSYFLDFHLWEVFTELDEYGFNSNFILPNLKIHLSKLDHKNDKKLITSFLEFYDIDFTLTAKDFKGVIDKKIFFSINGTGSVSLIDFFNLFDFHEVNGLLTNITNDTLNYISKQSSNSISFKEIINIQPSISSNMGKIIREYRTRIDDKIKDIELKLKNHDENLNDFLDMTN